MLYIAGPLDFRDSDSIAKRQEFIDALVEAGYNCFHPGKPYSVAIPTGDVQKTNNAVIGACDALVAFLPPDVLTVGTPIEIRYASSELFIPAVVLIPKFSLVLDTVQTVQLDYSAAKPQDVIDALQGLDVHGTTVANTNGSFY